jgi:glycosyltransferase involved in cell wall biosynthesis
MRYPRVIIIGETFRLYGGGGITLTNLFRDWPKENIGVVTNLISLTRTDTGYSFYQLGSEEIKFPWPFHPFQTYFKSGTYSFGSANDTDTEPQSTGSLFSRFKKYVRPAFDDLLHRTGLYSTFYKIKLSDNLKKWIIDFKPDIIYVQPFYHNMMRFGNLVHSELNIPYAIHIMDDSVMYINRSIFFRKSIQKRINEDFHELVSNADVPLCISEAMAEEYTSRYNKPFLHFRNPIDTGKWLPFSWKNKEGIISPLRIVYTGRTFPPYFESLIDACVIVDRLNSKGVRVNLDISSIDLNPKFMKRIKDMKGIGFYPTVKASEIPILISQYDVFLICEDFDNEARKYLKFSISTRASEGMISGVPILIYAPADCALSIYVSQTGSGLVIGERDVNGLEEALAQIRSDQECRQKISANSVRTALDDSDSKIVLEKFRIALNNGKNE